MDEIKYTTQVIKIVAACPSHISYKRYGMNATKLHFTADQNLYKNVKVDEYYIVVSYNENKRWFWQTLQHVVLSNTYNTKGD